MSSFTIRNYSESDFKQFGEFCWSVLVPDGGVERFFKVLRLKQRRPHYSPKDDLLISEHHGKIIGFVDITPELEIGRIIIGGTVHPEYRRQGVATRLVNKALQRGKMLGAGCVHVCIPESSVVAKKFLISLGFSYVRCFLDLKAVLTGEIEQQFNLPSSQIDHFRKGDEAKLAEIQNQIFTGSWGFCPNTADDIRYYLELTRSELEDILLINERSEIVGYLWPYVHPAIGHTSEKARGFIHMYGIRQGYRNKGLGRKLLYAGHAYLMRRGAETAELNVDEDNTQAYSLYQTCGYRISAKKFWYEKKLSI